MHLLLYLGMKIISVAIKFAKNSVQLQFNFNQRAYSNLYSPGYFPFESTGTLALPSNLFHLSTRKIGFLLPNTELCNGRIVRI